MGLNSDLESRRHPYSPPPSPDIHTNDMNGSEDDGTTGFDFDFVPPLDNKYMCPICLLALRDPVQTGCGHRFCHLCILRCIRNQARCPIDQTPLSSKQLFQDRSARREVLDLKVKCSNAGCTFISELRVIQKHIDVCPVRQIACKHKCGMFFSPSDVVIHEDSLCLLRPVTCPICGQNYPFSSQTEHEEDCKQHQPVDCPNCNRKVKRYRLNQHVSGECPQAPIQCVFDKVGCHRTHPRHEIQKHMEMSTQIHLQYLLSTVTALQKQNDLLQHSLKGALAKLKIVETSGEKINHFRKVSSSMPNHSDRYFDDDVSDTITNSINLYESDSEPRNEPGTSAGTEKEVDEIALIKAYNKRLEESDGTGVSSSSSAASSPVVLPNGTLDCPCNAASGLKVLQNKHTDHDQKIVSLDHHVRELMAKMENQLIQMKEITGKISSVEQRIDESELRSCNGLYHWRIKEYTKLRKAATQGDMPVLHSPGFYTSPQGYRMCIRANLNGVENAQGTHLSLFVHIMKGEHDDVLNWPFQGSITLTVINQRELASQRSHISETLEARSNLMAFRKPSTERNQKGYGYIDFFPLKRIESDGFIKANTLIIKAQVKVYDVVSK